MKELEKIKLRIEVLSNQNETFLKANNKLRQENEKLKKQINKTENYFTKYRTLYMKYKHQQNNFEKITSQYKEVIRLLQNEIIQNTTNEELFKKVEELNKLGV